MLLSGTVVESTAPEGKRQGSCGEDWDSGIAEGSRRFDTFRSTK